jgi:hypothetical protein
MSNRLLAILTLVAILSLGAPALRADHGDKGNGHQHGNKAHDDGDQGWERRDGYEIAAMVMTSVLQDGVVARKLAGEIVDCLRAKPRNTDARLTCTRAVPTTTTRMRLGGSSYAGRLSRFTAA